MQSKRVSGLRGLSTLGARASNSVLLVCLLAIAATGQSEPAPQSDEHAGMNMDMSVGSMEHTGHGMDSANKFFMSESSGTGVQPSAWPMPMLMTSAGNWRLMWKIGRAHV